MNKIIFKKDKYNFWKQQNPNIITYDIDYKKKQSTTVEMSYLRLGYLLGTLKICNVNDIKNWKLCDVGSGNGIFRQELTKFFSNVFQYDLVGNTITEQQLYNTDWDVIFLTDVLQHYQDVDDLFKIKFKYAFISFPETPKVDDFKQLNNWKHYKPNEHIYMLDLSNFNDYVEIHGYKIVNTLNLQDIIRTSSNNTNITTAIIQKRQIK